MFLADNDIFLNASFLGLVRKRQTKWTISTQICCTVSFDEPWSPPSTASSVVKNVSVISRNEKDFQTIAKKRRLFLNKMNNILLYRKKKCRSLHIASTVVHKSYVLLSYKVGDKTKTFSHESRSKPWNDQVLWLHRKWRTAVRGLRTLLPENLWDVASFYHVLSKYSNRRVRV